MKNSIRCARSWQIQRLKKSFLQVRGLPFSDVLSTRVMNQFAEHARGGRDRIFTPLVVLKAFLFQVLSQDGSCKHAVARVLTERLQSGQSANSINTGPYCKARQRLPRAPLENPVRESGQALHQRAPSLWSWRGHRVVLVDGTTALMPDTIDNQREFPQQGNQQPGLGFPIVRIVALISLGAGAVLDYALGPYQGKGSGESSLFSALLHTLQPGDLLLADRYYCTYAIVALLAHRGVQGLFQNHAQRKPHWHRGERLGAKDHLIKWAKPPRKPVWMSAQDYLELPPTLTIRELAVKGIVYVTTLSNSKRYPRRALAKHYRSRLADRVGPAQHQNRYGHGAAALQDPRAGQKRDRGSFIGLQSRARQLEPSRAVLRENPAPTQLQIGAPIAQQRRLPTVAIVRKDTACFCHRIVAGDRLLPNRPAKTSATTPGSQTTP